MKHKHYIKRKDGIVQRYNINDANFRKYYRKAELHRPRILERKFKKRVRVYEKGKRRVLGVVYRTIIVQNWKGSGCGYKRGAWSFTVDASVYTKAVIDKKRLEGLQELVTELASWIIDEFGFHRSTYDTKGAAVDQVRSREDARRAGLFVVNLDVEDVTMARGDYRFGRDIGIVNALMLDQSCRSGSYSFRGNKVVPWVAPDIRVHGRKTV